MSFGIGKWVQILDTGLLPGKMIQQLSGQTQRLLGQQALAAFNGLQLDIDRVRADNDARTGVRRKAGLIIHTGANPTAAMKAAWQSTAREQYGLGAEQLEAVEAHLQQAVAKEQHSQAEVVRKQELLGKKWTDTDIQHLLELETSSLSADEKAALLQELSAAVESLQLQLEHIEVAGDNSSQQDSTALLAAVAAKRPHRQCKAGRGAAAFKQGARAAPGGQCSAGRSAAILRRPASSKGSKRKHAEDDEHAGAEEDGFEDSLEVALQVQVAELQAMGFSAKQARDALEECAFCSEAAVEWLLVNVMY